MLSLVRRPRHTHKLTPLPLWCLSSALRLSHLKSNSFARHQYTTLHTTSIVSGQRSPSKTSTKPHKSKISNKRVLTRALQEMARGGRGGGSRNPANQPREVQVSRKISWLLRHGAASEGLKLGKGGYVNVQDAVSYANSHLKNEAFHNISKLPVSHEYIHNIAF